MEIFGISLKLKAIKK